MGKSVFVRYPDADKDSPDTPDRPNPVKKIAARKLDDYRANGYVQCEEDGTPCKSPQPLGAMTGTDGSKLAGRANDKEAAKVFTEAPKEKTAAPGSGASSSAGGGN